MASSFFHIMKLVLHALENFAFFFSTDPDVFCFLGNETMKPGVSSLNPYAASYIPLSKREACDRTEPTSKESKSGNENVWYAHPGHVTQSQHHSKISLDSVPRGAQKLPIPEFCSVKSHPVHDLYGSSSKQVMDEEFDIDLEYLQIPFPDLFDQSLSDVYLANKGDLEATVDMLTHLEFDTVESFENLPNTLDIGDVSESRLSSECGSMKLKTAVGEASASSSGPSGSAIVS